MDKDDPARVEITLDAIMRWTDGKASPEEKKAIRADLRSPDSRILTLFGETTPVIAQISTTDIKSMKNWKRAHPMDFPGWLTPEQVAAGKPGEDEWLKEVLRGVQPDPKPRGRGGPGA